MSKFDLHIKIFDEKVIEFIKVKPNLSFWVREIFSDILSGRLNYSAKNIKAEIDIQKLRKLKIENRMKEIELQYMENFGQTPSSSGKRAIKTNVYTDSASVKNVIDEIIDENTSEKSNENYRELTEQELNKFVELIALEPHNDGYRITCLICRNQFYYTFRLESIAAANRHLLAIHGKEFMEKMK